MLKLVAHIETTGFFLRINKHMFGGHLWVCLVMSLNILAYVPIEHVDRVAQSV